MNKKQKLVDAINCWRKQNKLDTPGASIRADNFREEMRQYLKGKYPAKPKEKKK